MGKNSFEVINVSARIYFKPRFRIRLRYEAGLFNKNKCSRTIFKDGRLLSFDFKNGSACLVLKKNTDVVDS